MGLMGLMGIAACDKIESEDYTVYDGAVITWSEGSAIADPVQRAYVEKYTGPRCSNCPTADVTLGNIHDARVVMVSINHPIGQGTPYPNQPDLRTDGGTAWDQYFGINAIPAAYINRNTETQYLGDMGTIGGGIDAALGATPVVALEANATYGSRIDVDVRLEFLEDYSAPVTVTVALVEDSLKYRQLMPDGSIDEEYVHNHMLRKVVTGFWGRDVDADGRAGEALKGSLSFSAPADVVLANSHVVVFVSDKLSRRVLNCASSAISND